MFSLRSGSDGSYSPDEINHRSILQASITPGRRLARIVAYLLRYWIPAGHAAHVHERLAVFGARPVRAERPHVSGGGISLMPGEAVLGVAQVQFPHQAVP